MNFRFSKKHLYYDFKVNLTTYKNCCKMSLNCDLTEMKRMKNKSITSFYTCYTS